jgi:hypothetical protein
MGAADGAIQTSLLQANDDTSESGRAACFGDAGNKEGKSTLDSTRLVLTIKSSPFTAVSIKIDYLNDTPKIREGGDHGWFH